MKKHTAPNVEKETMKNHKSGLFQSDVFSRERLPPAKKIDRDAEERQSVLREWKDDHEAQKLAKLAYALGVDKIILANREIDEDYFQGQYLYAGDSHAFHKTSMKPWSLSTRQLATIKRALRSDRDVILLAYESDFAVTLAHELGHHINNRLEGLSDSSHVTESMRRVAQFDEYFFQNKDEFYAETWSRFLCGGNNRTLFRYLKRPFDRLRRKHPQKTRLILELAKRCAN
jgi:hypothetical protein